MTYPVLLITLYFEFFKVGLFSIGGGLATIPFLQEIARVYPWFSESMLSDMIAISESTPGPIGVNMATYAGFMAGGGNIFMNVLSAIVATLGLVTPAIIIISIISKAYRRFKENPLVINAFYSIRPAVVGMIASVAISLVTNALLKDGYVINKFFEFIDIKSLILFILLIVLMNIKALKKLHPIVFIIASGIIGIIFKM